MLISSKSVLIVTQHLLKILKQYYLGFFLSCYIIIRSKIMQRMTDDKGLIFYIDDDGTGHGNSSSVIILLLIGLYSYF